MADVARLGTPQVTHDSLGTKSSWTVSYAVETGADCLVVHHSFVHYTTAATVTGITFNGISMTNVTSTSTSSTCDGRPTYGSSWTLTTAQGLTVTTANIVITFSSTATYERNLLASSYQNVDQSTPTEGGNTATGTSTTPAVSPSTTTASGDALVGFEQSFGTSAPTVADTSNGNFDYTNYDIWANCSYDISTGSGNSLNWTLSGSNAWAASCFVLKNAASSAGNPWYAYIQQ